MTEPLDDARGELLSCPFCGDIPQLVQDARKDVYIIRCRNDGCQVNPVTSDRNKSDAVEAWNTRPAPIPQCEAEPKALPSSTGQPARAMTHPVPEGAAEEAPPAIQRCDAEIADPISLKRQADEELGRSALVPPPSEAGREEIARIVAEAIEESDRGTPDYTIQARKAADRILALSTDPGTVAVASTHHHTPTE